MFGTRKKKEDNKMLNPKLGFGAKVIMTITFILFYGGIQSGLIGGAIMGAIAFGFYNISIKLLAKHMKLDLMVDKPLPTKEEIEAAKRASKSRVKFWTIFLSICAFVLLLTFLFVRMIN